MNDQPTNNLFFGHSPLLAFKADWLNGGHASDLAVVVIGGCARSGTTLMKVLLDAHREICCGPESRLFLPVPINLVYLSDQFAIPESRVRSMYRRSTDRMDFIVHFAAGCREVTGKPRWAEKTARNVCVLPFIFGRFPKARFIHMIRDGRDVVCSLRTHPKEYIRKNEILPTGRRNPFHEGVTRWVSDIDGSRQYWYDFRYLSVKYEELVLNTEVCLRQALDFIGVNWDPQVLDHHTVRSIYNVPSRLVTNREAALPIHSHAIGRWRKEMSPCEEEEFKSIGGKLLVELGYEKDISW